VKENFDLCLAEVLKHEGGFVNHPKDPGGMTNLGVTKRVWETWVKREVTEKEMRDLTPDLVRPLYKEWYWDKCRCDELPAGVDLSVFDFAVNAGVKRSTIILQRVAGVKEDGIFGPGTMKAVMATEPEQFIIAYFQFRLDFYKQLKNFETFGKGWHRRAVYVANFAKRMYAKSISKDSTGSTPSPSQ
jgi:lysozyme family protein